MKQELLNDLYALRAGLSFLSESKDQVEKFRAEIGKSEKSESEIEAQKAKRVEQVEIYEGKRRVVVNQEEVDRKMQKAKELKAADLGVSYSLGELEERRAKKRVRYGDEFSGSSFAGTTEQRSIESTRLLLEQNVAKGNTKNDSYRGYLNSWAKYRQIVVDAKEKLKQYDETRDRKTRAALAADLYDSGYFNVYSLLYGYVNFQKYPLTPVEYEYNRYDKLAGVKDPKRREKIRKKDIKFQIHRLKGIRMEQTADNCVWLIDSVCEKIQEVLRREPDSVDSPLVQRLKFDLDAQKNDLDLQTRLIAGCDKEIAKERAGREAAKARIAETVRISDEVYNGLVEQFSGTLAVSNWKILDAVIYYLQDGFADSVKEALQLVLQQAQNDRIVNAVESMERRVTQTVVEGIRSLQHTMATGFTILAGQLSDLQAQQSETNSLLRQQNAGLAALNESIDFGNALQAKANLSSEQLAEDMNYMRALASDAEVRRRNGL